MSENKKSKPGVFSRIAKWLRELKSELKKVQWPTAKQTVNNTAIVILCVIIVGVFIWVFDALASGVIGAILNLFK
ncbi:MAG: preprotein translocase subunit SecE [Oscillospiraceae bacterium]|nr:preprotein translocase subunit SecE [Oscillospiraceae bacterium]